MLRRKKTVNIAVSARTGNLVSSVRTISIPSVPFFVTRDSHLIDVKGEGLNSCEFEPNQTDYVNQNLVVLNLDNLDTPIDIFTNP